MYQYNPPKIVTVEDQIRNGSLSIKEAVKQGLRTPTEMLAFVSEQGASASLVSWLKSQKAEVVR